MDPCVQVFGGHGHSSAKRARVVATLSWLALSCVIVTGCNPPIEKLWQYQSYQASGSSPAVAGDLIVFGTESGEIHAVSRAGAFRWKFQTRKEVVSAPAVVDGLILFGSTNHNFYALDRTGRQVWKYTTFSRIKGDPLVVGKTVYFGSYDKHIYALETDTRSERWIFPPDTSGEAGLEEPAADLAADVAPEIKATWPKDAFSYARPTYTSDDHIVVGNLDGHVYAVKRQTGELSWRFATDGVKDRKGVTSTVVEKDGLLYFGANDGQVYAIKLSDQSVAWKFQTGDEVNSSPVIDESGTLYIGSRDMKLYALDTKTGAKKWDFLTTGPILSAPALYQGLLIFGAGEGDGHVYAVKAAQGTEFWKFKTGARIDADALIDGDTFYISSFDKNLYAFKINRTE
jgi:outer membrane protein assembly factor BamB